MSGRIQTVSFVYWGLLIFPNNLCKNLFVINFQHWKKTPHVIHACVCVCVCTYIYAGMCLAQAEFKSFLVTLIYNQVWATPRTFVTKCFITKANVNTGTDRALLQEESQNLGSSHWYATNLKRKWDLISLLQCPLLQIWDTRADIFIFQS